MPSRNTNFARQNGHSDIKHLASGKKANYKTKGPCLDTGALRKASGKKPYDPPTTNRAHWGKIKPSTQETARAPRLSVTY